MPRPEWDMQEEMTTPPSSLKNTRTGAGMGCSSQQERSDSRWQPLSGKGGKRRSSFCRR